MFLDKKLTNLSHRNIFFQVTHVYKFVKQKTNDSYVIQYSRFSLFIPKHFESFIANTIRIAISLKSSSNIVSLVLSISICINGICL